MTIHPYRIEAEQQVPWHLTTLGEKIWATCEEKGFHEMPSVEIMQRALKLMLIVGELGEALEDLRKDNWQHHCEEIADVVIRLLHYAADNEIDLDAEVARKMEINRGRPHKHGKNF